MQFKIHGLRSPRYRFSVLSSALLLPVALTTAQAQWVSTATKALPLKDATLIGEVAPSAPMHILVGLQVRNKSAIQPALKSGSSLTVSQFVAQFAPTSAQVAAVENYLSSYGFKNISVESNHLLVEADGTAADVEAAFNTALSQFSQNGKTIFANTLDAQVPQSLSGTVLAVLGLNNIVGLRTPLATAPCTLDVCPPSAIPPTAYSPQGYQIAYDAAYPGPTPTTTNLKQRVATGYKTRVAVLAEGNLGCFNKSSNCPAPLTQHVISGTPTANSTGVLLDLYNYEKNFGLPHVPVILTYAGIPSADTAGADEWDLDSQTSTGIAQDVCYLYFYIATSLTDSDIGLAINKFVSDDKAKALNISLGECEAFPYVDGAMLLDDEMFAEAALQGQTAFASSDDNGSACPVLPTNGVPASGPPGVSYPASSPYVIAAGGTSLATHANFTYDGELAWIAGGGGVSGFEYPPFWQGYTGSGTLPIVPSYEASAVGYGRGIPDVAMCADPDTCGAIIYSSSLGSNNTTPPGSYCCVGGTSLASPLSMGAWARIETAHNGALGFAGPLIYQLANGASSGPPPVAPSSPYFNDVQLGANGGYTAGPGYDYTTGLGSWDIYVVNQHIPSNYPH